MLNVGARPIFADSGPDLHLTVSTVQAAITPKTRCLIVPHLYGNTAPIDEIEAALKDSEIFIVDDAAQSFGARRADRPVGSFGLCGVVGCGPGKSLGGAAGGLLVTNDRELYERAAAVRLPRESPVSVVRRVGAFWTWFRFRKYFLRFKGVSDRVLSGSDKTGDRPGRMANLDAMLVLRQQRMWRRNASLRRNDAQRILHSLAEHGRDSISDLTPSGVVLRVVLILPEDGPSVAETVVWLDGLGIEAWPGYAPLHRSAGRTGDDCPITDSLASRVLLVPISYKQDVRRREEALEKFRRWMDSRLDRPTGAAVSGDRSGSPVALS